MENVVYFDLSNYESLRFIGRAAADWQGIS
jgi:hypothetical protein